MSSHLEQKGDYNGAAGDKGLELFEIGSCTSCGSKSVCKCQRCGDFYCSPQCQRIDWPTHRYICLPMPPLVKASNWIPPKGNEISEGKIPFLQSQMPNKEVAKQEKQMNAREIHPEATKIPTSESCVVLTGFTSSNRCYIRSTNPSDVEYYKKILKEIDEFGKSAPWLSGKPKINSYALALREGKWCRVKILNNIVGKKMRIQFIDYGCMCSRRQHELRQINNHLIGLPCFVHLIQLKDIKVVSSLRVMDALSKYTNQEYKLILEKEDTSRGNAKLFNWKTKALLNTAILQICSTFVEDTKSMEADMASNVSTLSNETELRNGLEKPTSNNNLDQTKGVINKTINPKAAKTESEYGRNISPRSSTNTERNPIQKPHQIQTLKPCLQPPFKLCPLSENDGSGKAIIADDSFVELGFIGCLLEKYCENLKEVTEYLRENSVSDQPYKPKLNEYCLAEFENEWYRAKVMEVFADDKYRVAYIDYTNEMELPSKSIRRYPMSLTVPCHTTLCAIDGLPENLSEKIKAFLKTECAAFKELHIDSIRMVEDVCYVESKQLLKKLHEKNLL